MSKNKYSKEFKLQLLKEHKEKGISYWKLGKDYGIDWRGEKACNLRWFCHLR